eukprot:8386655-Lingulodinium_polyedra.AAC.1
MRDQAIRGRRAHGTPDTAQLPEEVGVLLLIAPLNHTRPPGGSQRSSHRRPPPQRASRRSRGSQR